jgi:hypothetical protein
LFRGIELAAGDEVVGAGAVGVVGAGAVGVLVAGVVGVLVAGAVCVVAGAGVAAVAAAGVGLGAELWTTKVRIAVAWAPLSKRISR